MLKPKFRMEFNVDNAAFDEGGRVHETARILREVAGRLESGDLDGVVRDGNGNRTGSYSLDEFDES